MTDQEMLDNMRLLLEPIHSRLERIDIRLGNLENRMANLEYENRREHKDIRQDIHTIVTVLEMKGILPKTQIITGL